MSGSYARRNWPLSFNTVFDDATHMCPFVRTYVIKPMSAGLTIVDSFLFVLYRFLYFTTDFIYLFYKRISSLYQLPKPQDLH